MPRWLAASALLTVAAASVSAQQATVGVSLGAIRMRSVAGTSVETLQGPQLSLRGAAWLGRWGAELRFAGGLPGNASRGTHRDIVDGTMLVAYRARPYVAAWAGARAWWQLGSGGSRRYTFGQIGLQTSLPIGSSLTAHGDLWIAPIGHTSTAEDFRLGRGGAAGVTLQLPRSSLQMDLEYRVGRGTGRNPTVSESLETLSLAVEMRLR